MNGSFSQQDIVNGLITYIHNGNLPESDSFQINLVDGDGNTSGTRTVSVGAMLVPDHDLNRILKFTSRTENVEKIAGPWLWVAIPTGDIGG